MIHVIPATGPADNKTVDLVKQIRSQAAEIESQNHVKLKVTGSTAVNIDISQKLNEALPEFCIIIVGLAFVLLVMVFRSILFPSKRSWIYSFFGGYIRFHYLRHTGWTFAKCVPF